MSQNNVVEIPSKKDYTEWEVNGKVYKFDVGDVEDNKRYEKALEQVTKAEKTRKKTGKISEIVEDYCKAFYLFFDQIFGEGAGVEILGERMNAHYCNNIYIQFLAFITEQKKMFDEDFSVVETKYLNRSQRRANQKKKK